MIAERLVGQDVNTAIGMVAASGGTVRVVSNDGIPAVVTKDYQPTRLNLTVVDGVVVRATTG